MNVVILGCGPAGLLAAHAAYVLGGKQANIKIISLKRKSPMAGAQFIHKPIPGIRIPSGLVDFKKWGNKEGYAKKVYGDPNHPCSWDNFPAGMFPGWPMRLIYEWLWERWEDKIVDMRVTIHALEEIERDGWDMMISSIPLPTLCENPEHTFDASTVFIHSQEREISGNVVVYNGKDDNAFYRCSSLFGHFAMEWGESQEPNLPYIAIQKPQRNDCDCRASWIRVGRYGKWKRGVLVHHAYEEVYGALQQV